MNYIFYTAGTSYRNVNNFVDAIGAMSNTEIENLSVKLVRESSNKYDCQLPQKSDRIKLDRSN